METDKFAINNDKKRKFLLDKIGFLENLHNSYPEQELYNKAEKGAIDALYIVYLKCGNEQEAALDEIMFVYYNDNDNLESPYWYGLREALNMFNAFDIYKQAEKQFNQIKLQGLETEIQNFYIEQDKQDNLKQSRLIKNQYKDNTN